MKNMTVKKDKEFDPDNPEDITELRQYIKGSMKEAFKPDSFPPFEEKGVLVGSDSFLHETEEDFYLQELDEYTPEERRQRLKLHKQDSVGDVKNKEKNDVVSHCG